MKKLKNSIPLLLALVLIVTALNLSPVTANPTTTVSVLPDRTEEVPTGDTFGVDIYIADPIDLFGYEFKLKYDPDVLTANEVIVGDLLLPKYLEWHKEINNELGYVWLAVTQETGEVGVTTSGGSLALISFTVDPSGGSCQLSLSDTSKHAGLYQNDVLLVDSTGNPILNFNVNDGYFCSLGYHVHDIAITSIAPSATEVIRGDDVSVVARNEGYFTESFTVTAYAGAIEIGTQPVTLASGSRAKLTFPWDTTGVTAGEYTIWATAPLTGDADSTDNTYTMAWDFSEKAYVDIIIKVIDYPTAAFTYSVMFTNVTVDASASTPNGGEIADYTWDFGDGSDIESMGVISHDAHLYTQSGTFTVNLTVTDTEGLSDTILHDITVSSPPVELSQWELKVNRATGWGKGHKTTVLVENLLEACVVNTGTSDAYVQVIFEIAGEMVTTVASDYALLPAGETTTLSATWTATVDDTGLYLIRVYLFDRDVSRPIPLTVNLPSK